MKQFEIKFYREWYDALSEMTREDRAEAVLYLLEYAYEDKITDDRFIRIVTTLMRNKIDGEKSRHNKGNSHSPSAPSTQSASDNSANSKSEELSRISEDSEISANPENSENLENSGNSENRTSLENSENLENSQVNKQQPGTEAIMHDYFSESCQSFLQFCRNIKVDRLSAEKCALIFIQDWIKKYPDKPIPLPIRKQGLQMSPIDQFIKDNASPLSSTVSG